MNKQLDQWLQEVSRSFYLSLKILPRELRESLSIAYLWARKIDTIADAPGPQTAPMRRAEIEHELQILMRCLKSNDLAIAGSPTDLPSATQALPRAVRLVLERLFLELPQAMFFDLDFFSSNQSLQSVAQTEQYTDWAAGCVGVAWTELCHLLIQDCANQWDFEAQKIRGRALGQFLQWVNILRDQKADASIHRSYLPAGLHGHWSMFWDSHLKPRAHKGLAYIEHLPKSQPSLLISVSLPLILGLKTLVGLSTHEAFKLSRIDVLTTLAQVEFEARTQPPSLYKRIEKLIDHCGGFRLS